MDYEKFNSVLMGEINKILAETYKKEITVSKLNVLFGNLKKELKNTNLSIYSALDEVIELSLDKIVLLSIKDDEKFNFEELRNLLVEFFGDIKAIQKKGLVINYKKNFGQLIYGPPSIGEMVEVKLEEKVEENFGQLLYGPPPIEIHEVTQRKK